MMIKLNIFDKYHIYLLYFLFPILLHHLCMIMMNNKKIPLIFAILFKFIFERSANVNDKNPENI